MSKELSAEECRARYQKRLEQELDDVAKADHESTEDRKPVELDQQSIGRLSRMDALQAQAMAKAMQGRRLARTRAIEAALERLAGDDFGWCGDCGTFIGIRRLDLDPTILRCVDCAR
ncbi:MAG: TraR/DksA C4-type zinc finger protein [Pseudomonadota bacterium]